MTVSNGNWMDEALCAGKGDIFFAETNSVINNKKSLLQAKAMCSACTVVADCLTFAINNEEDYGIWGSFSSKERSSIKKNLRIKKITKLQASLFVNKSVAEVKEIFKNTIFTGE